MGMCTFTVFVQGVRIAPFTQTQQYCSKEDLPFTLNQIQLHAGPECPSRPHASITGT